MTEAAILALIALIASGIGAIVTLVVGRGQTKVTGISALTDDQREFAQQLLNDNKEVRTRLDQVEKELRQHRDDADAQMRKMRKRIDTLEALLETHDIPIPPNGE